ncbi:mitochondrial carnitine/acylcarnitine carrier protein [Xenopus laevis]|uniref:Mitochondrial carnitine/acylcarnitine carrier protein n=1 Tax=Xenopus laevis TaxID=8355 RepID=A0A8J0TJ14_XENLA|nr:mitochondrial carnitine/acylcarnitine carrier protein [Xenopus laevis]
MPGVRSSAPVRGDSFSEIVVLMPVSNTCPFLLCQVQSVTLKKSFQGPLDCAQTLYRERGIRGLYRGTLLTLIRDVPSTGVYFMSYEWMKEKMRGDRSRTRELRATQILLAGGVAGMCNWLLAIPADVLKSRFQTAPENRYKNVLEVLREVLQSEGPCGLYRGFTAAMLRAFPANAACFLGFEASMSFLNWLIPERV